MWIWCLQNMIQVMRKRTTLRWTRSMRSVGSHCSRCLGQRQSDMISGKSNPYLENADEDEKFNQEQGSLWAQLETSQCSQQRRRNDAKMEEAKVERMALIRSTLCIVCHMKRSHSQILILSSKQELLLGSKEQKLHLSKNVCTSYVNNFHLDMSIPTRDLTAVSRFLVNVWHGFIPIWLQKFKPEGCYPVAGTAFTICGLLVISQHVFSLYRSWGGK